MRAVFIIRLPTSVRPSALARSRRRRRPVEREREYRVQLTTTTADAKMKTATSDRRTHDTTTVTAAAAAAAGRLVFQVAVNSRWPDDRRLLAATDIYKALRFSVHGVQL